MDPADPSPLSLWVRDFGISTCQTYAYWLVNSAINFELNQQTRLDDKLLSNLYGANMLGLQIYNNLHLKEKKIIYIKKKVGDPKVPFSIATTSRCREGHYSFPWVAPLYP